MCDNLGRYTTPFGGCEWAQGAEVIVCGGSINSPQLLQVSGIGDPRLLQNSGIRTAHELRGVGQNLQDHLEVQRAQDDVVCVCARARAEKLLNHAETSSNSTLNPSQGVSATRMYQARVTQPLPVAACKGDAPDPLVTSVA